MRDGEAGCRKTRGGEGMEGDGQPPTGGEGRKGRLEVGGGRERMLAAGFGVDERPEAGCDVVGGG